MPFTHRGGRVALFRLGQRRDIGRRRRRRRAENVRQDVLAALDGRRARRIRRDRQDAALPKQSRTVRIRHGLPCGNATRRRSGSRRTSPDPHWRTCSPPSTYAGRCDPDASRTQGTSRVSRRNSSRMLSVKSGNELGSGTSFFKSRRYNHCAAKLVTSAADRSSASIRLTCCWSTSGVAQLSGRCHI